MNAVAGGSRSLRGRLARWMLFSTLMTMVVFAVALYAAFAIEDAEPEHDESEESTIEEAGEQMLVAMAFAAPFAIAVAVGGASWLSRRALAPLGEVIRNARAISSTDLHLRLQRPRERDEIDELIVELNHLFDRLQHGFDALGRYAVDASHELRTPLAVVVSELDVALRRPRSAEEWTSVAERTRCELHRLTRLVESLLALAHAGGPGRREERFDLREQVDLVLVSLGERAKGWHVELSRLAEGGDVPAWMRGDPDAIDVAVRNLVSNAIEHSPAGARVVVAVITDGTWLSVVVDDEGAGVASDERDLIFMPMRRGREAGVDRNQDGHGLGLAIATRIASVHGGELRVDDSPIGGARFVLRLPGC